MTEEKILGKAIEKAMMNGYLYVGWAYGVDNKYNGFNLEGQILYLQGEDEIEEVDEMNIYQLIFSHDFAKAFFGDGEHIFDGEVPVCEKCDIEYCSVRTSYCWQAHLHNMVTEEKPIKYLEQYL